MTGVTVEPDDPTTPVVVVEDVASAPVTVVDDSAQAAEVVDGGIQDAAVVTGDDSATVVVDGAQEPATVVDRGAQAGDTLVMWGETGPAGPPGPPGPSGSGGGSASLAVFTLDGADGDDGLMVPGPPGPQGLPGAQGPQGLRGAPGQDGEDGVDGMPGPAGPQGAPGAQGAPGVAVFALDGEDGQDGQPIPGPQGAPGIQGAPGVAVFVVDGTDGDDGAPGPQGPQGIQGTPGGAVFVVDGTDGDDGAPGPQGAQGIQGAPGVAVFVVDGDDGLDGFPGPAGLPGAAGVRGNPGMDGVDGDDAMALIGLPGITLGMTVISLGGNSPSLAGLTSVATAAALVGNGSANTNMVTGEQAHVFEIVNDNSVLQCFSMGAYGVSTNGNNMHFNRYYGTLAVPTAVQSGAIFMSQGFRGWDGTGSLSQSQAAHQVVATENWGANNHGIKFHWEVTPAGVAGSFPRKPVMDLYSGANDGMILGIGDGTALLSRIVNNSTTGGAQIHGSSDQNGAQFLAYGSANSGNASQAIIRGSQIHLQNVAGTDAIVTDTNGNVGIGGVPSAWGLLSALEGTAGAVAFNGATSIYVAQNTYYNGASWIYKNTAAASRYTQNGGQHQWFTAASGTAGATVAWTPVVTIDNSGNLLAIAGAIGYGTGSGGAVTQATSRTTGVTLNKSNGAITLFTAAGSATAATFTVTNSTVAATDTVVVSAKSGTNVYLVFVTAVAAGSFNITFYTTGGTASDTPVFNFAVIKAVTA